MGFSNNDSDCRVDFFKSDGFKWYTTAAVHFPAVTYNMSPKQALLYSLYKYLGVAENKDNFRLKDMIAVCIDPAVEHAFPVMVNTNELSNFMFK